MRDFLTSVQLQKSITIAALCFMLWHLSKHPIKNADGTEVIGAAVVAKELLYILGKDNSQ